MSKISKFLLRFSFIRFIRSFFYSNVGPWIKYFYYLIILAIIAYIPYSISQNKDSISIFKNRIINKYIEIIEDDDDFYNKVKIIGNKNTSYDQISDIIRKDVLKFSNNKDDYVEEPIISSIKNNLQKLPWIKNVTISRNLPSDLIVKIEEYEPFAIWQDNKKRYIINKNGKIVILLENDDKFSDLLILSGSKANLNANSLFNILAINLEISKNIYSATWVGSRRWDVRFNSDLIVKLPEDNIENAWKSLVKIYNIPGSLIDLKSIDLRIENKLYLEYDDNSIKDFKAL